MDATWSASHPIVESHSSTTLALTLLPLVDNLCFRMNQNTSGCMLSHRRRQVNARQVGSHSNGMSFSIAGGWSFGMSFSNANLHITFVCSIMRQSQRAILEKRLFNFVFFEELLLNFVWSQLPRRRLGEDLNKSDRSIDWFCCFELGTLGFKKL